MMHMATISERASVKLAPKEMPERDRPISEEYRVAAKEWVELHKASQLLSELKSATLAQMKNNLMAERGEMPDAKAERICKGSKDWHDYIRAMVEAEAAANLAKVRMKWVELRFSEWMSEDANTRKERQMLRQAP